MGLYQSKHIQFIDVQDSESSKEFVLQRKLHCKSEFILAKVSPADEYDLLTPTERESTVHVKRTTFLEPPHMHRENPKDIFRRRSMQNQANEFTFAKQQLEKKKNKKSIEKIQKVDDTAIKDENEVQKNAQKSLIKNKSHDSSENY